MPPLRDESPGPQQRVGRLLNAPGRSRRASLVGLAASLATLLFALVASGNVIQRGSAERDRVDSATGPGAVRLGGHAVGLYPGSVERLRVEVENVGRRPVVVRSVEAEVGAANRRCSRRNVSVSSFRGRLRVPPHRRRWVHLTVAMRPNAANACQQARFPLTYRAAVDR
jgi:hypothetical protein